MTEPSYPPARGATATPFRGEDPFYASNQGGIDLRSLADILLRGKWVVLASMLALAVPVAVYSAVSPSLYQAYAVLLVDRTNTDLSSMLPEANFSPWQNRQNLSNELLVIDQSMPLALKVAEELIATGTIPGTDRPLSILSETEDGAPPTALEVAFRLQDTYVDPLLSGGDADAIRVVAVSTDPREAALISNAYANNFAALTQDETRSGAAASREFLEGQVAEQSQRLQETDQAVEQYMLQEGAVALEEGTASIVSQIASLDAQRDQTLVDLQTSRAELGALRSELGRLESQLESRLSSNLDDELAAVRLRVQELRQQLEVYYTRTPSLRTSPDPPADVARLQSEYARAEAEQQRIAGLLATQSLATGSGPNDQTSGFTRAAALRAQITEASVRIRGLEAQLRQVTSRLREYEGELAQIPAQSIELAQLQRERQATERLYGALEENLQQARVAEQSQLGYASVIRPAYPADRPFSPLRGRNVFLAIFLGLLLGVALAIAKVRLDHRLHTPDDLTHLGLPLMGTIPSTTEIVEEEYDGAETTEVNGRMVDTHIVSLLSPMATASEAYRALRTNLQFSRPDKVVQTILVTSSNPSEGKSVTAANLAVVFAQAGRRVLLVDADLRRPTVHKKLGITREPGLVQELFSDEGIKPGALYQLADDLHILPAGSLAPNPSELIGSRRMREVIEDFRSKFDIIVFDAPPVLAATDAVLLSTQCDAVLMITRAGQTKDYEVQSALTALSDVGTKVSGLVLNAFDVRQAYGYRYKYAYRYGASYAYGSPANEPADA